MGILCIGWRSTSREERWEEKDRVEKKLECTHYLSPLFPSQLGVILSLLVFKFEHSRRLSRCLEPLNNRR